MKCTIGLLEASQQPFYLLLCVQRWLGFVLDSIIACLVILIVVFALALNRNLAVMERWMARPILFLFPVTSVAAAALLGASIKQRWDAGPFISVAIIFASAFGTLAVSFWPYMIPFAITIDQAAAPRESLSFMFWGAGLFVFPLMLVYLAFNYGVFRGKNRSSADHY